jgi:hypothetical protein
MSIEWSFSIKSFARQVLDQFAIGFEHRPMGDSASHCIPKLVSHQKPNAVLSRYSLLSRVRGIILTLDSCSTALASVEASPRPCHST